MIKTIIDRGVSLNRLLREVGWRVLQDFDREREAFALTELRHSIMLHEDLNRVLNLEEVTVD